MASPPVLDLERLLQPISAEAPGGSNLREDTSPTSPYYKIKDARAAARALERSALAEQEPQGLEHWRAILDLAPRVLAEQSKDLEVVAWLIEAEARIHGFAGLRDGFDLARGLTEAHWDHLFPRPDEEGLLTRVAPLSGLNGDDAEGTLIVPIARIAITNGGAAGSFASWQYRQAEEIARIEDPQKREARVKAGTVTLDQFIASVRSTPAGYFDELVADLRGCVATYDALCAALDARCGPDAPPASSIRNALRSVLDAVLYVARDTLVASEAAPAEGAATTDGAADEDGAAGTRGAASGPVASRREALLQLGRVAKYFRDTEPHSPISYLIDQAVRWGEMPLPALLEELIPDGDARNTYRKLTGIKIE